MCKYFTGDFIHFPLERILPNTRSSLLQYFFVFQIALMPLCGCVRLLVVSVMFLCGGNLVFIWMFWALDFQTSREMMNWIQTWSENSTFETLEDKVTSSRVVAMSWPSSEVESIFGGFVHEAVQFA